MAAAPLPGLSSVAIAQIDGALIERRRAMLAKMAKPMSRARVLTLVIGVSDEKDNQSAFDIVNQLAGKYPIRVIAVGRYEKAPDAIRAWVNTACDGEESTPICSEEIILQGGVTATERIVATVRSLVVSDLPVMLWWRGGVPTQSALWRGLFSLCDRAIVDSHRFAAGGEEIAGPDALAVLRSLVRAGGTRVSVRDLNWQRTAPWRAAIATCFDDREVLALLPELDRCSILFAAADSDAAPSARALLMSGWLESRLERLRGCCKIAPATRWAKLEPGRIVAITLTSSTSKASLVLIRRSSPTGVDAQANGRDGKPMRRWTFGASTLTEAELLDGCLETLGRDGLFEAALTVPQ
jgi:glucose-6-phosphate dehydrogenase assembly protein OpcA